MTSVVAIEFCASEFKSEQACREWIKNSEYQDLERIKGFHVRKNKQASYLTPEKPRPVFRYVCGVHSYPQLDVKRHPFVVVVTGSGTKFTQAEIPAMLPANILRDQKRKEDRRIRMEALRRFKEETKKLLPPKPKKEKARAGIKETTKQPRKTRKQKKEEEAHGIKLEPLETEAPPATLDL
jgi:hypothetical protein